jgi:hypothetical protein
MSHFAKIENNPPVFVPPLSTANAIIFANTTGYISNTVSLSYYTSNSTLITANANVSSAIFVVDVIVAEQDIIDTLPDKSSWIQTSYNTRANSHVTGGTPLRGNYAVVGGTYDSTHDVFYAPKPFPSWILNTTTWSWEAPIPYPTITDNSIEYIWYEKTQQWLTLNEWEELYG